MIDGQNPLIVPAGSQTRLAENPSFSFGEFPTKTEILFGNLALPHLITRDFDSYPG